MNDEQYKRLRKRSLRLTRLFIMSDKDIPGPIVQAEIGLQMKVSFGDSYLRAALYLLREWWRWRVVHSYWMMRQRERLHHLLTGRDGSEIWDKKVGEPTGSAQIAREEIKAILEGREPSEKIQ